MEIKHGKGGIIHGGSVSCTLQIAQAHPRGRKAPRKQDCQQPWEAGSWKNSTAPGHSRSWMVLDGIGWYLLGKIRVPLANLLKNQKRSSPWSSMAKGRSKAPAAMARLWVTTSPYVKGPELKQP